MVYSIVQIKTPSNGVQLWWSLRGLVRADQRERRRHQYTGTMQNAPIYKYILYRHHAQGTNITIYITPATCTRHQYTNIYYIGTTHLFLMLPVHIPQYTNKRCWACFTQQYQMHTTFILNQFQAQSLLCIKESGMQDEILKKRLEPETKIVGIFWCKFFRADSNFANLKRILGLFSFLRNTTFLVLSFQDKRC